MSKGVAAVDRALTVLAAFGEGEVSLSLAELSRRTGLYKSTILRLAISLERGGYLRRLEDGNYRLGPALLKLGQLYQRSFYLEDYAMPALRRLSQATGESASLYVREGDKRVCLFRVNSTFHRVLHYVTAGTALPLHTGASGRVLLAFTENDIDGELDEARRELLVVSTHDRKSDTAALACPVFGAGGFIGAMSLAGPRTRFGEASIPSMSATLLEAAAALSEALGGDGETLRKRMGAHGRAPLQERSRRFGT
jgi:DNA-binding IclR family transcriptional regulator